MTDEQRGNGDPGRADRATVVACFATVLFLAIVVCAFGFVSLLADVDVVSRPGVGGLVGPVMIGTSVLVVGASLVRDARRRGGSARRPRAWAVLVGMGAGVGYVLVGAALVAIEEDAWFDGVLFAASTLASAFPYIVGALAALVAVVFAAVADAPPGGQPRWPWERDERD